jgi:hypothetical protein
VKSSGACEGVTPGKKLSNNIETLFEALVFNVAHQAAQKQTAGRGTAASAVDIPSQP